MFIFEICQYCPQNCNYIYIHTRYFLVFFCLCEVLFWATCIELKNKDRINRLLISQFNEIKVFFSSIKPVINTMARHSDFVQYFSEYTTYVVHLQMAFWPSLLIFSCSKFSSWMKQEGGRGRFVNAVVGPESWCQKFIAKMCHTKYPPLQKMLFLSTPNNHREIINQFFDPGSDLEVGGTARCGVMIYVWWSQFQCFKLQ